MIEFRSGNLFASPAQALVNPVNCVGVMGAGLALQFKHKYPKNYERYKSLCDKKFACLGSVNSFCENGKLIFNFPTKHHYSDKSKLCDIDSGLIDLLFCLRFYKTQSVAIPALGCGCGGLEWQPVKDKIIERLSELENECTIYVYEPWETTINNYVNDNTKQEEQNAMVEKSTYAVKIGANEMIDKLDRIINDIESLRRFYHFCFSMEYFLGEMQFDYVQWPAIKADLKSGKLYFPKFDSFRAHIYGQTQTQMMIDGVESIIQHGLYGK